MLLPAWFVCSPGTSLEIAAADSNKLPQSLGFGDRYVRVARTIGAALSCEERRLDAP
jgi:hypothetical protein